MEDGRKIPAYYENPIDNIIIDLCGYISPLLYKYRVTPNMITTASLLCCLISLYELYQGNGHLAAIFWAFNYIFDTMDGNFARKYNMETEFGDWYDHTTDVLGFTLICIILIYQKKVTRRNTIILFILIYGAFIHLANQEKISTAKTSDSLNLIEKYIYIPDIDITRSRYMGLGTFTAFLVYIIYIT